MSLFITSQIVPAIKNNKVALISFWCMVGFIVVAIFAPFIVPYDPNAINLDCVKLAPSMKHWCGTDMLGRDILSRIILGSRISLLVGFSATVISLTIGFSLGLIGGFYGGKIDRIIIGLTDITLAFPGLLLAIGITAVFNGGIFTICMALSLVGWASFARIVRGEVISMKEKEYVEAGYAVGCSHLRVIITHVIPNIVSVVIVVAMMKMGTFILSEASLSFLGLGVPPPTPSWGAMINDGIEYMRNCPWMTVFPGLALLVAVLSFNLIGDMLRDFFDPKQSSNRKLQVAGNE
ncbi:MAG: ABC transporter permease [Candidatus Ancaeobacter aquaticus]|nr:ABC transporter permease [Candidatus Ancaeobacter aquaticus]